MSTLFTPASRTPNVATLAGPMGATPAPPESAVPRSAPASPVPSALTVARSDEPEGPVLGVPRHAPLVRALLKRTPAARERFQRASIDTINWLRDSPATRGYARAVWGADAMGVHSPDLSHLRGGLLGGLIDTHAYSPNQAHQAAAQALLAGTFLARDLGLGFDEVLAAKSTLSRLSGPMKVPLLHALVADMPQNQLHVREASDDVIKEFRGLPRLTARVDALQAAAVSAAVGAGASASARTVRWQEWWLAFALEEEGPYTRDEALLAASQVSLAVTISVAYGFLDRVRDVLFTTPLPSSAVGDLIAAQSSADVHGVGGLVPTGELNTQVTARAHAAMRVLMSPPVNVHSRHPLDDFISVKEMPHDGTTNARNRRWNGYNLFADQWKTDIENEVHRLKGLHIPIGFRRCAVYLWNKQRPSIKRAYNRAAKE
jgi:hypothetical protein